MIITFFIIASFSSQGSINLTRGEEEEEEEDEWTLRPNLAFGEEIQYPDEVEPNKLTTLKTKIKNNGQVDAQDIVILLKFNGVELERKNLSVVTLSQSKFVAFNWMSKPGTNHLEMVIDPDNTINEINEDDNIIDATIEVESEDSTPGFGAIGFLIVITVCILFIKRKN